MKIRLAKKIMKFHCTIIYRDEDLKKYWGYRWFLYDFDWHKDYRITKAISLTSKENEKYGRSNKGSSK